MKNAFNISLSQDAALCSLCQDTLLRHIRQSRVYWYCPSCRQEMVCESRTEQVEAAIATRLNQITHHHAQTKVVDSSQPVGVRIS